MQLGIRRIFLLYSATTAIIPMIIIGIISLGIIRHQLVKGIDESSTTLAHSVSNQITTYLREPESTFRFLASHLADQRHSQEALAGLLDNLTNAYNYFESVYLLDRSGIVQSVGFEKELGVKKVDYLGMDFSSLEIFQRAMGEKSFQWHSTLSVTSGEPSISFCAPLDDGAMLATLKLAKLSQIINRASSNRLYDAFIVDRGGRIIAHPDTNVVMRQENISNLPIIRDALAGKTSSGSFEFRNTEYRGSAVTVAGLDWVLVVAQDLNVAMAPVKSLEKILLAGMLATLLMIVIASSVASSLLSKPFAQLSENARKVIDEDYGGIKPITTRLLEITLLSETLGKMVDAVRTRETLLNEQTEQLMAAQETLQELNVNLEEKVAERTAKLEEAKEELFQLNSDLIHRTLALEDANHYLESFAYSISHDLRAPLRHIGSFSAILADEYSGVLDAAGQDYLKRIINGCKRMDELVEAILEFSRVTRKEITLLPVDMGALVQEVMADFRSEIEGRSVEIVLGDMPVCNADRVLMKQVVTNLFSNAMKYTGKRENPLIEIGSRYESGENIVFVKDNGSGFDMQYYDKLFGVFQRLHGQNDFPGVGVGLAITQNIVQRHGGRIWAESVLGQGATFYVALPV